MVQIENKTIHMLRWQTSLNVFIWASQAPVEFRNSCSDTSFQPKFYKVYQIGWYFDTQ